MFVLYAIILDFADYWRHRVSHRIGWWWALHSLHHAQRQMTFWSDDRNHLLDDLIAFLWFGAWRCDRRPAAAISAAGAAAALPGEPVARQCPASFGGLGERLLISPRFHRAHHGVLAAGQQSCNYGAVLPWWDMLFGTADFSRSYVRTGDPSGEEALHTGGYVQQQWAGLRRFARALRPAAVARRAGAAAK